MKVLLTTIIVLLVGVGLVAAIALGPFFYNRYVFPLGRLSGTISVGDRCEGIDAAFREYYEEHSRGMGEIYFSSGPTDRFLGQTIEPSQGFHLYHVNMFDDIQLDIICNDRGEVSHKLFIGD